LFKLIEFGGDTDPLLTLPHADMVVPELKSPPNGRVRVKICGITRAQDAEWAARLGVDAIGLVFYHQSPRAVTAEQARQIVATLPPFVTKVGLFVNATEQAVRSVLDILPLDLLQFHGEERPEECTRYGLPYIKAIRMHDGIDFNRLDRDYHDASGILLDSLVEGVRGGTGQVFNWSLVPQGLSKPIILAGGLTPDNVADAISAVRPYAVDVSGGVELRKGIKDPNKISAFIRGVWNARF
jgi:phosphoribosylanthranilate isomerase